jgi:alkanesulfonate monooxygenase SsuD/methylene tetrahydromethanopterin reductase-like flavin-dependent oxidoreductase (luciferase family)
VLNLLCAKSFSYEERIMQYALSVAPFGQYGDPNKLVTMARAAEDAGWDGFFLWDHMIFDPSFHPNVDPWVTLGAIAVSTKHIRLGTMVTPLARRRPWKVARETVSLDHLSGGRVVLGVGLGTPAQWDYGFFGEAADDKLHAGMLDEGIDVLRGLWSGARFSYAGDHYQLAEMVFLPRPVQERIPIWVGGTYNKRKPMQRAARNDGFFPLNWESYVTPEHWREIMRYVTSQRQADTPYDWINAGRTPGDNPSQAAEIVQPYADLGVTWWVEDIEPWRYGLTYMDPLTPEAFEQMDTRIYQGPPRL